VKCGVLLAEGARPLLDQSEQGGTLLGGEGGGLRTLGGEGLVVLPGAEDDLVTVWSRTARSCCVSSKAAMSAPQRGGQPSCPHRRPWR